MGVGGVRVLCVRFSGEDVRDLRRYVVSEGIKDFRGSPLSVQGAVHSIVRCFLDDVVRKGGGGLKDEG